MTITGLQLHPPTRKEGGKMDMVGGTGGFMALPVIVDGRTIKLSVNIGLA
jgi:hypothetical protein